MSFKGNCRKEQTVIVCEKQLRSFYRCYEWGVQTRIFIRQAVRGPASRSHPKWRLFWKSGWNPHSKLNKIFILFNLASAQISALSSLPASSDPNPDSCAIHFLLH